MAGGSGYKATSGQVGHGSSARPAGPNRAQGGRHSNALVALTATGSGKRKEMSGLAALSVLSEADATHETTAKRPRLTAGDGLAGGDEAALTASSEVGRAWNTSAPGEKKGRFTEAESRILKEAMDAYCKERHVQFEALFEFKGKQSTTNGAWKVIATCLPERSVSSCYFHATRRYHPGRKGPWTPEDIESLKKAVAAHGEGHWAKIGKDINCHPMRARDKWRELSRDFKTGRAEKEECDRIVELVQEHMVSHGIEPSLKRDIKIPWSEISKKLGTRSAHQIASLWYHRLNPNHKPLSDWTVKDTIELIKGIGDQGAESHTDIKWESLSTSWSGHQLRRKFALLTKTVPNWRQVPLTEVLARVEADLAPKLTALTMPGTNGEAEQGGDDSGILS